MDRYVIENKVAVILCGEVDAKGWYTYHYRKELIFDPYIVTLILQNKFEQLFFHINSLGINYEKHRVDKLKIQWVDEGSTFRIDNNDDKEKIIHFKDDDYFTI